MRENPSKTKELLFVTRASVPIESFPPYSCYGDNSKFGIEFNFQTGQIERENFPNVGTDSNENRDKCSNPSPLYPNLKNYTLTQRNKGRMAWGEILL